MSFGDYRTRSNDVRRAARDKLAELRAERLARRRYAAPAAAAPESALDASDSSCSSPDPVQCAPDGLAAEPAATVAGGLRFKASSAAARFAAEAARHAPPHAEEPPAPEPPPAPKAAPARAARAGASLSLHLLPGVGPGLIWLLNEQGVGSLDDLAAREPEDLRALLGLLGPFVDIDSWIAFAREQAQG
ncbi:MAG: hypothetical protein K2P95_02030 [Hyphomonadaceae bacterium]|nr:hypothetical protein [Hyphomonadaceae bacterium]